MGNNSFNPFLVIIWQQMGLFIKVLVQIHPNKMVQQKEKIVTSLKLLEQ